VASRAVAEIDYRLPPGLVVEDIEERVAALANGFPAMSWRRIKARNPN
jgi:succinyl-diaminopimelate desuccinylase